MHEGVEDLGCIVEGFVWGGVWTCNMKVTNFPKIKDNLFNFQMHKNL